MYFWWKWRRGLSFEVESKNIENCLLSYSQLLIAWIPPSLRAQKSPIIVRTTVECFGKCFGFDFFLEKTWVPRLWMALKYVCLFWCQSHAFNWRFNNNTLLAEFGPKLSEVHHILWADFLNPSQMKIPLKKSTIDEIKSLLIIKICWFRE